MYSVCCDHKVLSKHASPKTAMEECDLRGSKNRSKLYYVMDQNGEVISTAGRCVVTRRSNIVRPSLRLVPEGATHDDVWFVYAGVAALVILVFILCLMDWSAL